MTKTFKKSLALILSVIMLMSVMPLSVSLAAESGDFKYEISGDGIKITKYLGTNTDVHFPDEIDGKPVTIIGGGIFQENKDIQSVSFGRYVQIIGTGAFYKASNLLSVSIPKSVTSINRNAFNYCNAIVSITYEGTEEQWNAITVAEGNNKIKNFEGVRFLNGKSCEMFGHPTQFVEYKEPTCIADGNYEYYICTVETCKTIFVDDIETTDETTIVISATGHSFGAVTEEIISSCVSTGNAAYKQCLNCELYFAADAENNSADGKETAAEFNTAINAENHRFDETFTIDTQATCTTDGEKSKHCLNEGCTAKTEITAIPARQHNLVDTGAEGEGASCTETGIMNQACSNTEGTEQYAACDYTTTREIAAKRHNFDAVVEGKTATCLEGGRDAYKKCTRCSKYFAADADELSTDGKNSSTAFNTPVDSSNHDFSGELKVVRKATCTEDGAMTRYCTRGCGATEEETVILARKHNLVDTTEAVKAGCLTVGTMNQECTNTEATREYEACTYTTTREISALGHNLSFNAAKEPTCTTDGNVEYWYCRRCTKNYASNDPYATKALTSNEKNIPARHTLEETPATPATCTEDGIINYWTCKAEGCGMFFAYNEAGKLVEKTEAELVDEAKGHTIKFFEGSVGDCYTDTVKSFWYCDVCGRLSEDEDLTVEMLEEDIIIKAAHKLTLVDERASTCDTDGNIKHWHCEACDKNFSDENGKTEVKDVVIPAAHKLQKVAEKKPTCTETGNKEYFKCSVCGSVFADKELTGPYVESDYIIPARDHSLDSVKAKEPTCTEDGNYFYVYCKVCNALFEDKSLETPIEKIENTVIGAKGHTWSDDYVDGEDDKHYQYCTVDGCTALNEDSAQEHSWNAGEITTAPTCTETGVKTLTCTVANCKATKTETVKENGHTPSKPTTIKPTCTKPGYTDYTVCTVSGCGIVLAEGTETAPLGHSWQNNVGHVDETCTTAGTHDRVCKVCKVEDKGTYDMLGHDHSGEWMTFKKPDCTRIGYEYNDCLRCGEADRLFKELQATGHADADFDHVCDNGCDEFIGTCADSAEDADHVCDYGCGDVLEECLDADTDHTCDNGCDVAFGGHGDADYDHNCDYGCNVTFGTHSDTDKDHACDYGCKVVIGTCADEDKDHNCDYGCDASFGTHADGDKDHACDYGCDVSFGTHADGDTDHDCDYGCEVVIGVCADADKDHACDYGCDASFGTHADGDTDHACDYGCEVVIGVCADADKDHNCDYGCGKNYGTHADTNKDHNCDYGCTAKIGTHADADKDHDCDYGCTAKIGTHEDEDKDHDCDYGCDVEIGTCADADKDHDCDYGCDASFGTHADADKDHDCDYGCAVEIGACADADKDHECDYGCDATFGTHTDADKDHDCDYGCEIVIGRHIDIDFDHICDYGCAVRFGVCADSSTDDDHVCDYGCGEIIEDCEDGDDNDHDCDICDAENVSDHDYAEATCVAVATCTVCGATTGELDADNHDMSDVITEGKTHYVKCQRTGCDYKANVAHAKGEVKVITEATCKEKGKESAFCYMCKYEIIYETEKVACKDTNNDKKCDWCGADLSPATPENPGTGDGGTDKPSTPQNPAPDCDCACHDSGIRNLFFKILLFFQKFLKMNSICDCGKAHY